MAGMKVNNQILNEIITQAKGTTSVKKLDDLTKKLNESTKTTTQLLKEQASSAINASKSNNDLANRNKTISDLMQKSGLSANRLARGLKVMGYTLHKNGKLFDSFDRKVKMSSINMKGLIRASRSFNMSALSGLFFWMQMQRYLTTFLRSAVTTFQSTDAEMQGLGEATWQLQAGWEFLKYSLVDALTQSDLFKTMVGWIVDIINWFNALPKSVKSVIGWVIVFLAVLATIAFLSNQIKLFGMFDRIRGLLAGGLNPVLLGVIAIIIGIGLVIYGVINLIAHWSEGWAVRMKWIGIILLGLTAIIIGVAIAIGSWPLAIVAAVILILALIAFLVSWMIKHWDEIKIAWYKVWGSIKKAFITFLGWIQIALEGLRWFFKQKLLEMFMVFAWLVDSIRKLWVNLMYSLKIGLQTFVKFFLDKLLFIAEKAANLLDKLGLDGLADKMRSGIDKIRDGVDAWGDSIKATRDEQLKAIEDTSAVNAVKKLMEANTAEFNQRVAQINAETKAKKAAIDKEIEDKIKAAKEAAEKKAAIEEAKKSQNTKADANKDVEEANKNTGLLGMMGSMFGGNAVGAEALSSSGNTTNTSTNIDNFNLSVSGDNMEINKESIASMVNESLGSLLSGSLDSNS